MILKHKEARHSTIQPRSFIIRTSQCRDLLSFVYANISVLCEKHDFSILAWHTMVRGIYSIELQKKKMGRTSNWLQQMNRMKERKKTQTISARKFKNPDKNVEINIDEHAWSKKKIQCSMLKQYDACLHVFSQEGQSHFFLAWNNNNFALNEYEQNTWATKQKEH